MGLLWFLCAWPSMGGHSLESYVECVCEIIDHVSRITTIPLHQDNPGHIGWSAWRFEWCFFCSVRNKVSETFVLKCGYGRYDEIWIQIEPFLLIGQYMLIDVNLWCPRSSMLTHSSKAHTIWLFNSSPWKDPPCLRTVNHLFRSMGHLQYTS